MKKNDASFRENGSLQIMLANSREYQPYDSIYTGNNLGNNLVI